MAKRAGGPSRTSAAGRPRGGAGSLKSLSSRASVSGRSQVKYSSKSAPNSPVKAARRSAQRAI